MKRMGLLSLALVAAMTWGCGDNGRKDTAANAPAGSAVGTAGSNDVSRADKDFVHDVAIANMAEIDAGHLAVERATMPATKKFAQMMIDDHTAAGEKLKTVATQYNIEVPAQVDESAQKRHDKLAAKTGADFDKEYADAMVDGHQDFVDKLESRIDKTKLSDWKTKHEAVTGQTAVEKGEAEMITPEKSDNPTTAALNQWAADTYPKAWAHLQAAKDLQKTLKKRMTH
jgi:putative membrane protein